MVISSVHSGNENEHCSLSIYAPCTVEGLYAQYPLFPFGGSSKVIVLFLCIGERESQACAPAPSNTNSDHHLLRAGVILVTLFLDE